MNKMVMPFDLLALKDYWIIWFPKQLTKGIHADGYSRDTSCALN
jgi:hypothetical protein